MTAYNPDAPPMWLQAWCALTGAGVEESTAFDNNWFVFTTFADGNKRGVHIDKNMDALEFLEKYGERYG